jgi:DNA-binding GntR family transcriptional regulator
MAEIIEISRAALHEQVAARLRSMLIEGRIAPGAKLKERELCEQLRVSRTPLREAIKLLAAEGLADLVPNRGAIAVKLSETDVMHTFEVLAGIEGQSGELAAQRITAQEFSEIKALHYEMMASVARRDISAYYRLNAAIHAALNDAAKNPVLTDTYRRINNRVQSLRFRTNLDSGKWQQAIKEHEAMLQALEARDAPALRRLLVEHLHHKRDAVLAMLRAESERAQAGR